MARSVSGRKSSRSENAATNSLTAAPNSTCNSSLPLPLSCLFQISNHCGAQMSLELSKLANDTLSVTLASGQATDSNTILVKPDQKSTQRLWRSNGGKDNSFSFEMSLRILSLRSSAPYHLCQC